MIAAPKFLIYIICLALFFIWLMYDATREKRK